MAESITGLYPYDPSGSSPQNRVTKEIHSVQFHGNRAFIIPHAAPFFARNVRVYNANTNENYKEGVDYLLGHIFYEAMEAIGQPIYGSILFINEGMNPLVGVDYNTIGGKWGHSDKRLSEELANQSLNPEQRTWGMIEDLPDSFVPIRHEDSLLSIKGFSDFMTTMDQLVEAVRSTAEGNTKTFKDIWEKLANLKPEDVGLGNVPNFPVANDTQATEGTSDAVFMTAYRTAMLIDALVGRRLTEHEQNERNPHHTTKVLVDLGDVANYAPATKEIAEKGESDAHYMTPLMTLYLLRKQGHFDQLEDVLNRLTKHENDRDNPHRLTPAKIGTLTTEEIKDLIEKHIAGDTERFAGKTEAEWLKRIPDMDEINRRFTDLKAEMGDLDNFGGIVSPDMTFPEDPKTVTGVYRLGEGYYITRKDNSVEVSPNASIPADVLVGAVSFNNGDNKNIYVVKNNILSSYGPDPIPVPTRFTDPSKTQTGIISVFETNTKFFVITGDNILYRYDNAALKANPGVEPEMTLENVVGGHYIQDTLTRYAIIRSNDIEVYEETGARVATATLGNYSNVKVHAVFGYENNIVINVDVDSVGMMGHYLIEGEAINNKATFISNHPKRTIVLNKDVVVAVSPEFSAPKFIAITQGALSEPYLYVDDHFRNIEYLALGKDSMVIFDSKQGVHVLSETPFPITPTK